MYHNLFVQPDLSKFKKFKRGYKTQHEMCPNTELWSVFSGIPLVFKFYVLIFIYFRATFMEIFFNIFIWVWFL